MELVSSAETSWHQRTLLRLAVCIRAEVVCLEPMCVVFGGERSVQSDGVAVRAGQCVWSTCAQ